MDKCCPRVVFIDLDGTIWDCLDVSELKPPFQKVGEDTLIDRLGSRLTVLPDVRDFLKWLKEYNIVITVLSWNMFSIAYSALRKLNLVKYFDLLYIEPHSHKGYMMKRALKEISRRLGVEVSLCEVVYVDDRDIHLEEVRRLVGDIIFIKMWKDVASYNELKHRIKHLLEKCSQ